MGFFNLEPAMESIVKLIDDGKMNKYNFEELIELLYAARMGYYFEQYASCVMLMYKYKFYDPYIFPEVKKRCWKLKKADRYNLTNIEKELIYDYRKELWYSEKDELLDIVSNYERLETSTYTYKNSVYYFNYQKNGMPLNNHYACVAASELLSELHDVEVYFDDLSDSNDDDIRAQKAKKREEFVKKAAISAVTSLANKYVPDDEN